MNARKQAQRDMNDTQEYLYSDPESGEKLSAIASNYQIQVGSPQYKSFALTVGDIILGITSTDQLPQILSEEVHLSQQDVFRLTADIIDFLSPLKEEEGVPSLANTNKIDKQNTNLPSANNKGEMQHDDATSTYELAAEIAEAEAALQEVQPMRTMAHDMEVTREVQSEPTQASESKKDEPVVTNASTTPPSSLVAAAAEDRIPTPSELMKPAANPNSLVADGAGNQVRNHAASWGSNASQ